MERISLSALVERIKAGENLEVGGYEGEHALVDRVKGIVKGDISAEELSDLKRRRPRGGPAKKQLEAAGEIARRLAENRITFKVVFGPREATIRVGRGFIRLVDGVRIAGFSSLDEEPLPLIMDVLEKYGDVKLLKPLK
ncbi:MAG: hypothetical protein JHC22_06590 [Thermoproteus sp.]|jgi:hypothetical protein|nr:hypothetical protein [Thermoproteus sp.]